MKRRLACLLMACMGVACLLGGCKDKKTTGDDTGFVLATADMDKYITKMADYSSITVEAKKQVIDDATVEYFEPFYFKSIAASAFTDKVTELGDTVNIDFVGKIDGVAFDGGTAQGYDLELGSGAFIAGFEDGLVGYKVGDIVDLNLTFPENYGNTDLAGQACVFTCTINLVIPPYTDENVAKLPDLNTKEKIHQSVREYLEMVADNDYEESVIGAAIDRILSESEFSEVPQVLLDKQAAFVANTYSQAAAQNKVSLEAYLASYGTTPTALAKLYAQRQMICQKIANDRNLVVSDDELNEKIDELIATGDGTYASAEEFFAANDKEEYRELYMTEKVYDYLMSVVNVVEPVEQPTEDSTEAQQ